MHKRRTQSMQRYHKVHEIDVRPAAHLTQSDLLPGLDQMTLGECQAERGRLLHEKTRAEQELIAAKRECDTRGMSFLGLRIQGYSNRLSMLNSRMKAVRHDIEFDALKQAVIDVIDEDTWQRIVARKAELRKAMLAGAGA